MPGIRDFCHKIINHRGDPVDERLPDKIRGNVIKDPCSRTVEPVGGNDLDLIGHGTINLLWGVRSRNSVICHTDQRVKRKVDAFELFA